MSTSTINGQTFTENNVSIINGVITIDGVRHAGTVSGVVEVRVLEGVLNHLSTDASVSCGEVLGTVTAGGSVNCDNVGGSVMAGGSVRRD